ncbi:hypothetical protein B0H17DRAFT_1146182 [Mycena rosella]|uniref:Uncharacterized protein n=1 Tax=Mycena rosella TaxID=1033263 RepID=A0AAD7CPG7_MYCRO|nr:hypothetical protein B0H17DRAFT_1146182 [Mycena rosella]
MTPPLAPLFYRSFAGNPTVSMLETDPVTQIAGSWEKSTYKLKDHIVPVEDGEIRVHTISPTPTPNEDSEFPVLVYLHGGDSLPSIVSQFESTIFMPHSSDGRKLRKNLWIARMGVIV